MARGDILSIFQLNRAGRYLLHDLQSESVDVDGVSDDINSVFYICGESKTLRNAVEMPAMSVTTLARSKPVTQSAGILQLT
jgi:hypothetical protein